MAYYDWSKITEKYTDDELKRVVRASRSEPKEKITAALQELSKRGINYENPDEFYGRKGPIVIDDPTVCYYCKSKGLKESDKYCPVCAFPQGGTRIEMNSFMHQIEKKQQLLIDQKKAINKARIILFILAGINFVFGIILGQFVYHSVAVIISCVIAALLYFLLGLWSRKQPFPAILTGLIIYIFFIIISAFSDPTTIYQGILWKVLIISGFIYGYQGAKDSKKLDLELKSISDSKDLSAEQ